MSLNRWGLCPEVDPDGQYCGLTVGHNGPHKVVMRNVENSRTWRPRWAQSRTSRVVIGCLVLVLVWVISLPLVIFLADSSVRSSHQSDFPDFTTVPLPTYDPIEFGTGGAGCTLATTATTFSTRDRIRLVAASVPGGEEASILLLQGDAGRLVAGYPVTRLSDQTADCVDDVLPPLPADHYSVEISIPPGPLVVPRFMGTFNVTP